MKIKSRTPALAAHYRPATEPERAEIQASRNVVSLRRWLDAHRDREHAQQTRATHRQAQLRAAYVARRAESAHR